MSVTGICSWHLGYPLLSQSIQDVLRTYCCLTKQLRSMGASERSKWPRMNMPTPSLNLDAAYQQPLQVPNRDCASTLLKLPDDFTWSHAFMFVYSTDSYLT